MKKIKEISKKELAFKEALEFMPRYFNAFEIWNKLQELSGVYDKKWGRFRFKISDTLLYKYLHKYCQKEGKGQWREK